MMGFDRSDDYRPFGYLGGYPIYATTLLVSLHVFTLVAFALAGATTPWIGYFIYDSWSVLHGFAFWQFVTYAFVHFPTLWVLIDLFFLFWFGREVERFIGRSSFLTLYALVLLLPPALLTAIGSLGWQSRIAGASEVHFAIFIAFVTIYPGVQFWGGIVAKWLAIALLAIWSLEEIAARNFGGLIALWGSSGMAFAFIRNLRGHPIIELPKWQFRRKPQLRVMPPPPRAGASERTEDAMQSIDPLLDKIARSGLASLTDSERAKLEQARAALLRNKK